MRIEELEILMQRFYELDSDEDELLLDELLKFANNDKEEFIAYVNSQKLGLNSYRPILYESIMDNAKGWEDFLLEQIKYIIEQAESGNKEAYHEISSIYYLTNISQLEKSFYVSGIEFFKPRLNSKNKLVKKAALEYIIDLHSESNITITPKLKKELQKQLKDQNYNVRLSAFLILKDENLLPEGYQQSIMDKFRTWISSDYRYNRKAKKLGKKAAEQIMKKERQQ